VDGYAVRRCIGGEGVGRGVRWVEGRNNQLTVGFNNPIKDYMLNDH
jgi:hypothetical protein